MKQSVDTRSSAVTPTRLRSLAPSAAGPHRLPAVRSLAPKLAPDRFAPRKAQVLAPDQLGTTYTEDVARNAGLTDGQAFKMMHDMGITVLRLGAYWDQIQAKGPGQEDFSQLDRQLALARKYHMKVILTVGMKAPGWPEGHIPSWAMPKDLKRDHATFLQRSDAWLAQHWGWWAKHGYSSAPGTDLAQNADLRKHALAYDKMLVEHVAGDSNIVAFQVENEPGVQFGPVGDYVGANFVKQEAQAIRAADPARRPLALNVGIPLSKESEELIKMPEFSLVGLDVYPEPGVSALGKLRPGTIGERSRMVTDPRQAKALVEKSGKQAYVAEMQAEPWNPVEWNANKSMENFDAQRRNGFDVIFPWNVRFVFSQYQRGDKSEFEAWKAMGQDLQAKTPPPPDPHGSLLARIQDDCKGLVEFFSGNDRGRLLGY